MIKTMNDIDSLYDGKAPISDGGSFICPVCNKTYKTEKGCISHIEKRDCYDIGNLFENTLREANALSLYKDIMADVSPNARTSISYFRKSKRYKPLLKYTLVCTTYEIDNCRLYYAWIRDVKGHKHINSILSAASKESYIREYRSFLRENPDLIENSETFIERNYDSLREDEHFFTLSLEKSHFTIKSFLSYMEWDMDRFIGFLSEFPLDYRNRIANVIDGADDEFCC